MTLIQVIDVARGLLNEPLDASRTFPDNTSSFWTDAQLTAYFNLAQTEVQQEIVQSFEDYFITQTTLSIVNGTAEYTLPSGFNKIRRLEDVRDVRNPSPILPVSLNNRTGDNFSQERNSAAPVTGGYYIRGSQIILTETPTYTDASAIRMHYVKTIGDLSAGSETSEIPAEHHRALVWGVVKFALFQQQSDTTLANQEFEKHLIKIKMQAENRQLQKPRKVVRSQGDH